MDLKSKKVQQIRCHYDPMVGGQPKQAFNLATMGENAHMEITPVGVFIRCWVGGPGAKSMQEHVVPFPNIQSIMLAAPDEK